MESLLVSEFKTRFSAILKRVRQGESFLIVDDTSKTPVAQFVPVRDKTKKSEHATKTKA
jgi:antitoxin (DNA-binding transcriptional repressor) of toxin-antitoxin stability system